MGSRPWGLWAVPWRVPGLGAVPLQDVVNTHPGLAFLKEAAEFHSRYITTVSAVSVALTPHSVTRLRCHVPPGARVWAGACGRAGGQWGCALSLRVLQNCHDDAAKFVHLLVSPGCSYLVQEDFVPFLQVRARRPLRAPLPCVLLCTAHAAVHVSLPCAVHTPICTCPPHACPVSAAHPPPPLHRRIPILHLRVGAWLSAPGGRLCCLGAWLCALGGPPPRAGPVQPLRGRMSSGMEWTAPPLSLGAWTQTGTGPFSARLSQTGSGFAGCSFQMPFCFL